MFVVVAAGTPGILSTVRITSLLVMTRFMNCSPRLSNSSRGSRIVRVGAPGICGRSVCGRRLMR